MLIFIEVQGRRNSSSKSNWDKTGIMRLSLIFGFWAVLWLVYMVTNFFSGFVLASYLGKFGAQIFGNMVIIPFYFYMAIAYLRYIKKFELRSFRWFTGTVWVLMSMIMDYIAWRMLFNYPHSHLIDQYKIWQGSLYPLQLLALFVAVPIMRKHRRKFKQDPIINLFQKGKFY